MTSNLSLQRGLLFFGIACVLWIAVSFIYAPILTVLQSAFIIEGTVSFDAFAELASSKRVKSAIQNTFIVTVLSVITVNIVGVFQVAALEYISVRGRTFLKFAYSLPLVFVSVVAATGYNFAYGQTGVVTRGLQSIFPQLPNDWFSGIFAVVIAHTFLLTSFHFLFLRAAMKRVDYSMVEAARSLGAGNFRTFTKVVLPLLMPTIFATSLLVTYKSLGSFAIPAVLGGRKFDMVPELILTLNSLRRPDMAAMLSIGLGIAVIICIIFMQQIEKRGSYTGGAKTPVPITRIKIANKPVNTMVHVGAYLVAILQLLPVFLIFIFSFAPAASILSEVIPSSLSLDNYIAVFSGGAAFIPLKNSLLMATGAVAAGLAVSLLVVVLAHKYKNGFTTALDLTFMTPWMLPAPFIAIGLIVAFSTPNLLVGNYTLLGSYWILPIGYAIVVIPLMIRFLRAAFWSLDPTLDEAGRSLGASPIYRFIRITLPTILPVIVLVAGMNINSILSEYSMSAFLFNVNNKPLSIALFEGARSSNPEQGAINLVYMTLIMVFSFVIISFAQRHGLRNQHPKK
ncbi:ABC transporter permease [Maritalea sp.]|uniref:ABC transporter permease n=1 Tax=Maritalea sp. TaxID=2003361 RepID=UPI003EFAC7C7